MAAPNNPDFDQAIITGNVEFALNAYAGLRGQAGNLFLSPYSIMSALAMAMAGARGETERQMAEALGLPADQARVHSGFAALNSRLNGEGDGRPYQLSIANALWGALGAQFRAEFLQTVETAYGGKLAELDFARAPQAARATINQWVEARTAGKIKNLLGADAIVPDTSLVLTNAIYFKANWADQFAERWTKNSDFKLANGQTVNVPLMHNTSSFRYSEEDDFQAVELAYEQNELGMIVLLPRQVDGLPALEESLTAENLTKSLSGMSFRNVAVQLPRLKLAESLELSNLLSRLGMRLAFTRWKADFSGMAEMNEVFFSAVIHKAYIDVDEKGTEAAAATAVVMRIAGFIRDSIEFRADHPFLFLIRENRTGAILFIGRVINPVL
jgi:serpin B